MKKLVWLLALLPVVAVLGVFVMLTMVFNDGDTDDGSIDSAEDIEEVAIEETDDSFNDDGPGSDTERLCLGEPDPGMTYEVGYRVIAGRLGATCHGDKNADLEGAWKILSDIVPQGQLRDLSSFTGFTQDASETLAFVTTSDETGSTFEMAVNLDELEDRWELNLTMLHEFSHVFTATPNELDRSGDEDDCDTYWNSEGCYLEGSIMADWVQTFWAGEIGQFDPTAPEDDNGAQQRCSLNPGFFGDYGATSPEEDFAEAFSAFVFRLEAETPAQQERLDWIGAQRGLVEFRDRASNSGYEEQLNYFARCG